MRRYVKFTRPNGNTVFVNANSVYAVERYNRSPLDTSLLTLDAGFDIVKGAAGDVAKQLWDRDIRRPRITVAASDPMKDILVGIPEKHIALLAMSATTTDKKGGSFTFADTDNLAIGGSHVFPPDGMQTSLQHNPDSWCQTDAGKGLRVLNPNAIPISLLITLEIV